MKKIIILLLITILLTSCGPANRKEHKYFIYQDGVNMYTNGYKIEGDCITFNEAYRKGFKKTVCGKYILTEMNK